MTGASVHLQRHQKSLPQNFCMPWPTPPLHTKTSFPNRGIRSPYGPLLLVSLSVQGLAPRNIEEKASPNPKFCKPGLPQASAQRIDLGLWVRMWWLGRKKSSIIATLMHAQVLFKPVFRHLCTVPGTLCFETCVLRDAHNWHKAYHFYSAVFCIDLVCHLRTCPPSTPGGPELRDM